MKIKKVLNLTEIVFGVLCCLYYVICAATVGTGISILYIWLVIGGAMVAKGTIALAFHKKDCKWIKRMGIMAEVILIVFWGSFGIFSGFVIGDMHDTTEVSCDYMIVLGTSVIGTKPSEILQARIDTAYEYLVENPDTKVIGTGGRGVNDEISEGMCIAKELEAMGIEKERILYEEKSTTTIENFQYAMEVIPDSPENIVVVSNGFHIFRAKFILSQYTDANIYGIAAPGGGVLLPHYILREYITLIVGGFWN